MIKRIAAFAVVALAVSPLAFGAGADEASGVNNRTGNESPAAGASGVDNYLNQNDQLNLGKDDGIVRVLRTNQKVLVNDFVTAVFPVKKATPRELRDALRIVVAKEGGRAEVILDKAKGENFIHVICPRFQLPYIQEAIEVLDQSWVGTLLDGSAHIYYRAKHRSVVNLLPVLDLWLDSDGANFLDVENNALHRADEPMYIEQTLPKAMEAIDVPPPQLMLEGALYEVDASDDLKLGLDFIAWKNGPGRNLFEMFAFGARSRQHYEGASSIFDPLLEPRSIGSGTHVARSSGYYKGINFLLTAAYLDFLASKGKAKILARPRILTKSGIMGEFLALDPIPSFSAEPLDPGPRGLVPATPANTGLDVAPQVPIWNRTLRYKNALNAGITLQVTPVIALEATEATINLTVSDISGLTPQGIPMLATRQISTVVRLKDGEPFVMGGIRRMEKTQGSTKIPVLGSIPVLGYLFGGETSATRQTELVLIVTPTISRGPMKPVAAAPGMEDSDFSIIERAKGAPAPMDPNPFGFDQWVLDDEEKPAAK
ncbi:MAG: type II and III secretion system protein [Planctomycetota bacterium]